ncbi:replication protein RepB, partial [Enterococcus faecium]
MKIDWNVLRDNKNPKTKQPYKRGRTWTIVVYLDSVPIHWESIIKQDPVAISPLLDKDITEDGERKKQHYHVILSYKGNKSVEQIDEIARLLHAPIPQRINSLTGAVRYLTHMDNPEKDQDNSSDISGYGG